MTLVAVLLEPTEVPALVGWALRLGEALEEEITLVWASDSKLRSAVERSLEGRNYAESDGGREPEDFNGGEIRLLELEAKGAAELASAVLDRVAALGVTHLLLAKARETDRRRSAIARSLFDRAPCRVILLRPGRSERDTCRTILVPASGGPHASAALRIGARLALTGEGTVTPLYVEPPFGREAKEVGAFVMKGILKAADLGEGDHIEPRVVVSADPERAIAAAAEDHPDLVLLGASEAGSVRRRLFGTIPDRCLGRDQGGAIGVVRERRPLGDRLRARLERWLDLTIPQLSRDERVTLFETIRSGSTWRFDFMALIALSTSIATLGLLQDSTAVVIGAMLVAPLMTPLLGAGLAVVQGNLPLLRSASQSILLGFLTALAIGVVLGWLVPIPELTSELAARSGPTLLDLGIAFFSGLAAAYCLGRPPLSAALPGVAIAAALVPPIATVGITLARGEFDSARGAALLFGTNVVAIVLGGAFSLYAGGIRPKRLEKGERAWARAVILSLLLIAAAFSLPLGSGLLSSLRGPARLPAEVSAELEATISGWGGATLRGAEWLASSSPTLQLTVECATPPSPAQVASIERRLREALDPELSVRVTVDLVVRAGD